jgi:integrase
VTLLKVMLVGNNAGSAIQQGYIHHDPTRGLEVPQIEAKPLDPDVFDWLFAEVRMSASQPWIRFHDLRHFFASFLIAQGFSAKYVCDQLGPSSIQMTFDTYGHLFPRSKEEASAKLAEAIRSGRRKAIASGLRGEDDEIPFEEESPKYVN